MANSKEAKARIKINKLLEETGWRFLDTKEEPTNIQVEPNVKLTQKDIDAFGEDFEFTMGDFIDFLLLDEQGFPLVVLEAKKGNKCVSDFLYQMLRSNLAQKQYKKLATGAVVKNLNSTLVKNIKILFPPHEVQKEIVSFMEKCTFLETQIKEEGQLNIKLSKALSMI